jgi:hypothetical protein
MALQSWSMAYKPYLAVTPKTFRVNWKHTVAPTAKLSFRSQILASEAQMAADLAKDNAADPP